MYEVETKRLNEAVRRNIKRFEGDDYMLKDEATRSRSQFATLNRGRGSNMIAQVDRNDVYLNSNANEKEKSKKT